MVPSLFAGGAGEQAQDSQRRTVLSYWSTDVAELRCSITQGHVNLFNSIDPMLQVAPEYFDDKALKKKIRVAVAGNSMPDVFVSWSAESFKTKIDAGVTTARLLTQFAGLKLTH
ncbi:MAG: hypothetical protein EA382_01355, partial [Spirochaetaceae bacterium]